MNPFFKAHFNYFPIIWMFHSYCLNNRINRLHERCLRMVYNDKVSNFEELLNKNNSVSINHDNIHALAIEMYKVANDMSSNIMNEVFKLRNTPFIIYGIHRMFLQTQSIVPITELNQYLIQDQIFGSKYLLKLKIRIPLMVLRKKLKNGNLLNVHIKSASLLYQIQVLFEY